MSNVDLRFKLGRKTLPAVGVQVIVQGILEMLPKGFISNAAIDVAWVLDCSGSMSDQIHQMLRRAMKSLHGQMGAADKITVIGYDSSGWEIVPLVGKKDFPNYFGQIDQSLRAGGTTYAAKGLEIAVQTLSRSNAATKVVVLLTDGAESDGVVGEQAAAQVLVDKGLHVIPITIDPSVPQSFFDALMAVTVDPSAPLLPAQSATTQAEIEALPGQIYGKLRSRIGADVKITVDPSGMAQFTSVYQVAPNLRSVVLQPSGEQFVIEPNDDLTTNGMSFCIQAEYDAPEPEDAGMQPFLNGIILEWTDLATGQAMSASLGTIELEFVEPGMEDKTPDPALNDVFRLVMVQKKIDDALRLAQSGNIDQSIAALDVAGSIAAASGNHSDLVSLAASLKQQVRSGSLSAQTVGASIARTSLAAGTALGNLKK